MVFNSKVYNPQMRKGKYRKKMTGGIRESEITGGKKTCEEYENDLYYPQSILDFGAAGMRAGRFHTAQKPVPLLEYLIMTYTDVGDVVLDSCAGSYSTGIACHNTGRKFIGFEKDKEIFKTGKDRLDRETAQMNLFDFMGG